MWMGEVVRGATHMGSQDGEGQAGGERIAEGGVRGGQNTAVKQLTLICRVLGSHDEDVEVSAREVRGECQSRRHSESQRPQHTTTLSTRGCGHLRHACSQHDNIHLRTARCSRAA